MESSRVKRDWSSKVESSRDGIYLCCGVESSRVEASRVESRSVKLVRVEWYVLVESSGVELSKVESSKSNARRF